MRRGLYSFAAALSLLLCVATMGLWVRSYSGSDSVSRRWMTAADAHAVEHRGQQIQWTRGQVRFLIQHETLFSSRSMQWRMTPDAATPRWSYFRYGAGHVGWDAPFARNTWNRLGFAAWETGWDSSFDQSRDRVWAAPAWLLPVSLAVLPAACALGVYRRQRRKQSGRCTACGYDLRASPDRCPECGIVNGARRAAAA
jgi:hypothetical protein